MLETYIKAIEDYSFGPLNGSENILASHNEEPKKLRFLRVQMKVSNYKNSIICLVIITVCSYPFIYFPSGEYDSDRVYFVTVLSSFFVFFLLVFTVAQLALIIKNRDDKYQTKNHQIGIYFIIAISLSTFYYFKVEEYKETSTSHVYCGSILKMRSSVGLLEKFALSKEKCGSGL